MLRQCWKTGVYLCSAVLTPSGIKGENFNKTEKTLETGWDRVLQIFKIDEYGDYSPELSHIYQTSLFTAFFGAFYGGVVSSRKAYLDFIERNEATKFRTHFEAKKELQNYVTVNFVKGAFKWSWRLAIFGGLYVTYVTCSNAYRGEQSVFDYVLGGLLSGAIYRINYGVRGVIVGGTIGSLIGLTAGCLTISLLRLIGSNYEDIYEWEGQKNEKRLRHIKEATSKSQIEEEHLKLLKEHDKNVQ